MLPGLRRWLRFSRHVHVHQRPVASLADIVRLVDRFVDHQLQYPLEWDDFICWEHPDREIEDARLRLARTEPLFFSTTERDRQQGMATLLEERNRLAHSVGLATRPA